MVLKRLLQLSCIVFFSSGTTLRAQNLSSLSDSGYSHWVTASRLSEAASSIDDYILIAKEYEQVLETDPSFEETYLTLVQLYEKIGNVKGMPYLNKAEQVLNRYASLKPGDTRTILTERTYLSALKDKYNSGPYRFVGVWGLENGSGFDLEIKYDGNEYSLSFLNLQVERIIKENDYSFLVEGKPWERDLRDEIRERGWKNYIDEMDSYSDPGFPKSGQFRYNSTRTSGDYRVLLEGNAPKIKTIKQHTWYYLDGSLTYSRTFDIPFDLFSSLTRKR